MKLGLIADLHADIRAVETALHWLDEKGIERIVCAGDLVGYGTHPDPVVSLVRERGIPCVRGNHDRWALERRQVIGLRGWRPAEMADETWSFLEQLPARLDFEIGGCRIAVCHGSPSSDTEFVVPYKPLPESVEHFWNRDEADLLVLGHTHIPMVDRGPHGMILNPGSVMGVTGIQTSYSFAIVDIETLGVRIYEVRTGREIRRDPVYLDDE